MIFVYIGFFDKENHPKLNWMRIPKQIGCWRLINAQNLMSSLLFNGIVSLFSFLMVSFTTFQMRNYFVWDSKSKRAKEKQKRCDKIQRVSFHLQLRFREAKKRGEWKWNLFLKITLLIGTLSIWEEGGIFKASLKNS